MRVLLTGMSGTGKSALIGELRARGFTGYDADDDGFTRPKADGDGRWAWDLERIASLFARHTDRTLFFAGCSEEQVRCGFDLTVLLTAPASKIVERLRTRRTNPYGKSAEELDLVLDDLREVEPLLRRSADLVIDTTLSLSQVADLVEAEVAAYLGAMKMPKKF